MRRPIYFLAPALIAAFLLPGTFLSFAATQTATFDVTIEITGTCTIVAANDLDFGQHASLPAAVDFDTNVDVQCTNTLPYFLRLNAGTGTGATVASRLMTGPGGATIEYSLYTDAAWTDVWGDTPLTDAVAGVGDGAVQSYPVYGRVPAQATPVVGVFTDTITVTIEF